MSGRTKGGIKGKSRGGGKPKPLKKKERKEKKKRKNLPESRGDWQDKIK